MIRFAFPLALALCASTAQADMTLTSKAMPDGGTLTEAQILNGFGCTGGNQSPDLAWSNAPAGTGAFAVMMYDPDAPTGSGWWHWVAFNLPGDTTLLPEGASGTVMPAGTIESRTDFGTPGFGGACPPEGAAPHPYQITVYALPAPLPLDANASGAMVGFMARASALDSATITATLGR
ncbi:YbhB/YbcL family Raf kinase inhibitor-like protein [Fuscibacter oryzae]|uniref:YbhB/YbcL family Raf kinase inhibitor-like protein n=1 Tax=Fuscibacter oryzae TaxID=2803939 RepID=A0A8J7MMW2_9RHOB|nr:YbhB/YbcL family Raf kinase inhibitor-like protein [Fuscibacter oryzae]MBL4927132.1 YbhB/YbcL family Raf kinase inhibitor-like protein [Fuscibacter oryzae]